MPIYDYLCSSCHVKRIDVFVHRYDVEVKCKQCGALMKRLFPDSAKFIGAKCFPSEGIFLEHVGPHGKRFFSEKEMRTFEKKENMTIGMLH